MSKITSINIEGKVDDLRGIHFVRVEWRDPALRFVLIRFAEDGRLAPLGIRLDLDKRVVLDRIGHEELDLAMADRAARIWQLVVEDRQSGLKSVAANVESLAAHP